MHILLTSRLDIKPGKIPLIPGNLSDGHLQLFGIVPPLAHITVDIPHSI